MITAINSTKINHSAFQPFNFSAQSFNGDINVNFPTKDRNYAIFDKKKVDSYLDRGTKALPELKQILAKSDEKKNEKQIVETLYILDRMIDRGIKGVSELYPELSRFNQTKSPNIQTYLAGIYRKTQVPDGFGPLIAMLIKNSMQAQNPSNFDPNEEIGGAILAYIENYSKKGQKLDIKA